MNNNNTTTRRCSSCRSTKPIAEFQGKKDPSSFVKTCSNCRRPARMVQRVEAVKRFRQKKKEETIVLTPEEKKEHRRIYMRNYMRQRAINKLSEI